MLRNTVVIHNSFERLEHKNASDNLLCIPRFFPSTRTSVRPSPSYGAKGCRHASAIQICKRYMPLFRASEVTGRRYRACLTILANDLAGCSEARRRELQHQHAVCCSERRSACVPASSPLLRHPSRDPRSKNIRACAATLVDPDFLSTLCHLGRRAGWCLEVEVLLDNLAAQGLRGVRA